MPNCSLSDRASGDGGKNKKNKNKITFEICGTDKNITAIPNSMEKFMTFGVGDIKFIDSFQFMASSLETLAEHLITKSKDEYEMFENLKNILTLMS